MPSSACVVPFALHSFPTRRSSDLLVSSRLGGASSMKLQETIWRKKCRVGRSSKSVHQIGGTTFSTSGMKPSSATRRLGLCGCRPWRSEEHTSELQSHSDLVCRLLLALSPLLYTLSLHDALPIF